MPQETKTHDKDESLQEEQLAAEVLSTAAHEQGKDFVQ